MTTNHTSLSFPLQTSLCVDFVRLLYVQCSLSVNLYVSVICIVIHHGAAASTETNQTTAVPSFTPVPDIAHMVHSADHGGAAQPAWSSSGAAQPAFSALPDNAPELGVGFYNVGIQLGEVGGENGTTRSKG